MRIGGGIGAGKEFGRFNADFPSTQGGAVVGDVSHRRGMCRVFGNDEGLGAVQYGIECFQAFGYGFAGGLFDNLAAVYVLDGGDVFGGETDGDVTASC